jgi:integrase
MTIAPNPASVGTEHHAWTGVGFAPTSRRHRSPEARIVLVFVLREVDDPELVLLEHPMPPGLAVGVAGEAWTDTGSIFTREDGTAYHPQSVSGAFERAVRRSGLPVIRFHDLRHTHASLLLAALVHPKVVQERLGHSSIGITLDLYSHVAPGMQEEAAERLGAIVFGD